MRPKKWCRVAVGDIMWALFDQVSAPDSSPNPATQLALDLVPQLLVHVCARSKRPAGAGSGQAEGAVW